MGLGPLVFSMSGMTLSENPEPIASSRHSWGDDTSLVQTVVETLEAATGQPSESLAPLHHYVDVDALETVFGPRPNGVGRSVAGQISFTVAEHEVVVESDGRVLVRSDE
ncbi:hypothetical protein DMJ13_08025 [halophilic archaeon]|nr:hypothetical protein DMJ13_08025 [halophilic archaeon]